jgi:hypothetical protein
MSDFKLTLTSLPADAARTAADILATYGGDFDADLGEFFSYVEGDTIEIIAKNVGKGDVKSLSDDLLDEYETIFIRYAEFINGGWFPVDEADLS